ncbi:hypothetical protein SRB5_29440 [Streptomyces sp. RB5]|uniref:Peptidoglycan recognition protein family domain-containing protein n=1 Tax=Streptomyces smaragdinus TaxID=2585196 RepID=A0A7K0CH47_9ACTN|nr:hypothetical protein [Streptomyces smaragdinus]
MRGLRGFRHIPGHGALAGRIRTRPRLLAALAAAAALVAGLCVWLAPGGGAPPAPAQPRAAGPPLTVFHAAVRPTIVPRSAWIHDTARDRPPPKYAGRVTAVVVHHTDSPNSYDCADAPGIIRALYTGQTEVRGWDDLGYNFLVDRCGTIYEGRAGGIERAVVGAHAQGFNRGTTGIAALGTFTAGQPVPAVMEHAIAAFAAWKLGRSLIDPREGVRLVSSNDHARFPAGTTITVPAIAGHDAGYETSCPGAALSARLPAIREAAARLQGLTGEALPPYRRAATAAVPVPKTPETAVVADDARPPGTQIAVPPGTSHVPSPGVVEAEYARYADRFAGVSRAWRPAAP